MSTLRMTACDVCGAIAPDDHTFGAPSVGWTSINRGSRVDGYLRFEHADLCSDACVLEMVSETFEATRPKAPKGRKRPPKAAS